MSGSLANKQNHCIDGVVCQPQLKPTTSTGLLSGKYRYRCGFSLIELLVVIAVIAVVTALLLPALSRARDGASIIYCKNNQRQLTLGMFMYAEDNDDFLPLPGYCHNHHANWVFRELSGSPVAIQQKVLPLHAESGSIFTHVAGKERVLPMDTRIKKVFPVYLCPDSGSMGEAVRVTYSMNVHFQSPITEHSAQLEPVGTPRSAVTNPEEKVLLVDDDPNGSELGTFIPANYKANQSKGEAYLYNNKPFQFPHMDRGNIVFVDGHIETIKIQNFQQMCGQWNTRTKTYFDPLFK